MGKSSLEMAAKSFGQKVSDACPRAANEPSGRPPSEGSCEAEEGGLLDFSRQVPRLSGWPSEFWQIIWQVMRHLMVLQVCRSEVSILSSYATYICSFAIGFGFLVLHYGS